MKQQVKQFVATLLGVGISTAVALILAEVSVRVLMPDYAPGSAATLHYYPEHKLVLGLKNSIGRQWDKVGEFNVEVRFNDLGLRDEKDVRKSRADDILLLGDSFMAGYGVAASRRCSEIASARAGKRIFNAAIGSSDIDDYRRIHEYLSEQGAKASRIVVGVFLGNDLRDYTKPKPPPNLNITQRVKSWFETYSALYRLAATVLKQTTSTSSVASYFGLIKPASAPSGIISEEVIASSADEVRRLTEGFDSVVVLVPTREYWIPQYSRNQKATYDAFLSALRQRGLKVLDWAEGIADMDDGLSHYFNADGHWNNAGHRRCGELLGTLVAESWTNGNTHQN